MKQLFTIFAAFAAALVLNAAEQMPAIAFKGNFKGLKPGLKEEKIFVKAAPSLKLSKAFCSQFFYRFNKEAQQFSGKKIKVTFSAYREKGSVPLLTCVRFFAKDNKYLGGNWPTFPLKQTGKWETFSFTYQVKESSDIGNINVGFMLDNKKVADDVVYIDEPFISIVE